MTKKNIKIIFEYTQEIDPSEEWWKPFDTPERLAGHFSMAYADGKWVPEDDMLITKIYVDGKLIDEGDYDFMATDEEDEDNE